jgi:hypothetical protein
MEYFERRARPWAASRLERDWDRLEGIRRKRRSDEMSIIAKASGGNFIPAPEGTWSAVCVDVVDLGVIESDWGGEKKKQHKIRIVWQIEEVMADNRPYVAGRRYTLSLHKKATLRKDLESWRGRQFTPEELEGFDVETVIDVPCLLNIIQEKKDGETYSNVTGIMRLPKGMVAIKPRDYVRVKDRKPQDQTGRHYDSDPNEFGITDDDVPF